MDTQFNMWTRVFDAFMVISIIAIYPIALRFNHILIYLNSSSKKTIDYLKN